MPRARNSGFEKRLFEKVFAYQKRNIFLAGLKKGPGFSCAAKGTDQFAFQKTVRATSVEDVSSGEAIRLKARLNEILAYHTGQELEVIDRDTERDFYMDAQAAVEYGLVDEVLEPPSEKKA